jgi:hypothetical protein
MSKFVESRSTADSADIPPSVEVDVKMSGPARFWGIADGWQNMKDASMDVVIGRLREMKAK